MDEEDLELFHEVTQEIEPLHKELQERQKQDIEDADMDEARFREIAQAMQRQQDPDMSSEEEQEFQELQEDAQEMQQELREKLMSTIEEKEGIDQERFQAIAGAVERDPSLQEKLEELESSGE